MRMLFWNGIRLAEFTSMYTDLIVGYIGIL